MSGTARAGMARGGMARGGARGGAPGGVGGVEGTGRVQRPLLDPAPCYSPYVEGSETSWGKVSGAAGGRYCANMTHPLSTESGRVVTRDRAGSCLSTTTRPSKGRVINS